MNSHFKNDINTVQEEDIQELSTLPLVHTSNEESFRGILNEKYLERKFCKFFKEEIVYFYYALPVYLKEEDIEPFVLLFEVDESIKYKRITPFDTGGCCCFFPDLKSSCKGNDITGNNRSTHCCYASDIGSFCQVKSHVETYWANNEEYGHNYPKKLIKKIFGSNNNYFKGKAISLKKANKELDFWANKHVKMVQSRTIQRDCVGRGHVDKLFDLRCFAIELQYKHDFPLDHYKLLYVILPQRRYSKYGSIIQKTFNYNVAVEGYTFELGTDKATIIDFLKTRVKRFLNKRKLL